MNDRSIAYQFIPGKDPERLLVIFSAANSKGFTLYADLASFDGCDKLFVRDPYENAWYQRGIGGEFGSPEALSKLIIGCKRSPTARIYTAGVSMGAYASILFGVMVDAYAVLAIAPQVRLTAGAFRNPKRTTSIIYPALDDLVRVNDCNVNINVFAGLHDYTDIYHLSFLSDLKNLHFKIFLDADHSLPKHIHAKTGLGKLLSDFVDKGQFYLDLRFTDSLAEFTWLGSLKESMHLYLEGKLGNSLNLVLNTLGHYPDWVGGYIFAARLYKELGQPEMAATYWLKSLELVPHLTESLHQLHHHYKVAGSDALASYFLEQYSKVRKAKKGAQHAINELNGMI